MAHSSVPTGIAIAVGVGAVYLLPPPWLAPLSAFAAACCAAFAIILRFSTNTEQPSNAAASILLSTINLPEQPLAKVKEGWCLSGFLTLAAFLVSLGLSVLVRASV